MSDDKPWNKPLDKEAAERLLKAIKAEPRVKNEKPKPEKENDD